MSEQLAKVAPSADAIERKPWWRAGLRFLRADLASENVTRAVIVLALPILLTSILHTAASVAKLYWVGRFGPAALASVAISETIAFLLFPFLIGISTGTTAIVSRAVGAKEHEEAALAAAQSILLAMTLGLVATLIGRAFSNSLLWLVGADADVVRSGHGYLGILLLGIVPLFVTCIAIPILQATGHTAQPMFASLITAAVTLAIAPCLMFGPGFFPKLGVNGGAWATVLGDSVGMVICLWMIARRRDVMRFHLRQWKPHWKTIGRVMRIGAAGFGALLLRTLAGPTMLRIVSVGGTTAVAAFGIGLRLDSLVLTPSFALGGAAATMVGISLGAKNPGRAAAASWAATLLDLGVVVPMIVLVFLFAPRMAANFNDDPAVVEMASSYLRVVWPMHIFTAACITLGRAMQGAGDTKTSMYVTIIGLWLVQLPLAKLLASVWQPPYQGIWLAVAIAAVVQGVLMILRFNAGHWKTKAV